VAHEREIVFDKHRLEFMLSDQMICRESHNVERFFHFSEHCKVDIADNRLKIKNNGYFVEVKPLDSKSHIELHHGNDVLPLGWTSRSYDQKVPSFSAVFRNDITGTTCLRTNIKIHKDIA
jgi:hypothetical protein